MTMMTRTKTILLAAALFGGATAIMTIPCDSDGKAVASAPAAPVTSKVVAPATVESVSERVELAFEQAGRVTEVLVAEGQRVEAGQVLARLDSRVATARVARAEAALASAEARLEMAERGARSDEIRAARAEAKAARAQADERGLAGKRAVRLRDEQALSDADADAAIAGATAAEGQANAAEARLSLLERGTRTELRREAAAAVAAAKADLDEAKTYLSQTELRAPRAGTILRRYVEPGESVVTMPPTVVVSLADLQQIQLRAEVDEVDVARLSIGQRGYATAEGLGDVRIPGKIVRLTDELGRKKLVSDDPRSRVDTRVLEVLFVPDAGHPALPLGLRLDVHLEDAGRPNG
jgi:multidrug resistance efflux pump